MPYFKRMFFDAFTSSLCVWNKCVVPGSIWWFVLLLGLLFVKVFYSILSKAHVRYLPLVRTSLNSSVLSSSSVEQTALALFVIVLMVLYFPAVWWWLSHCRSWSLCIVFCMFWYDKGIKKGHWGIWPCVLHLDGIAWSIELICCTKFCLCSVLCMT